MAAVAATATGSSVLMVVTGLPGWSDAMESFGAYRSHQPFPVEFDPPSSPRAGGFGRASASAELGLSE